MDRNTEIEQYFALWNESFPVAATHDHWVRWGKLLRVWLPSIDGVPMNVEVTGDFPRALKKWTSLELELRLLFLKRGAAAFVFAAKTPLPAKNFALSPFFTFLLQLLQNFVTTF